MGYLLCFSISPINKFLTRQIKMWEHTAYAPLSPPVNEWMTALLISAPSVFKARLDREKNQWILILCSSAFLPAVFAFRCFAPWAERHSKFVTETGVIKVHFLLLQLVRGFRQLYVYHEQLTQPTFFFLLRLFYIKFLMPSFLWFGSVWIVVECGWNSIRVRHWSAAHVTSMTRSTQSQIYTKFNPIQFPSLFFFPITVLWPYLYLMFSLFIVAPSPLSAFIQVSTYTTTTTKKAWNWRWPSSPESTNSVHSKCPLPQKESSIYLTY